MSKWIVDIHGDIEGDYEIIEEYKEPKIGHWKPYLKEGLRYQCSVCDSRFDTPWEYCPNCGAKMEKAL